MMFGIRAHWTTTDFSAITRNKFHLMAPIDLLPFALIASERQTRTLKIGLISQRSDAIFIGDGLPGRGI